MKKLLAVAIISVILGLLISGFLKLMKPSPAIAGIIIGISLVIMFLFLYKFFLVKNSEYLRIFIRFPL